jgi:hypothetical protein
LFLVARVGFETGETSAAIVADRRENAAVEATKGDGTRPDVTASAAPAADAVEAALAGAICGATDAARWDVVAQLARELEARRTARAGNVVVLQARVKRSP